MAVNCDFCDKSGAGNADNLPSGWVKINSDKIGDLICCDECAAKRNAPTPTRNQEDFGDLVAPQSLDISSKEKLKLYVSKLENLMGERAEINEQMREVYGDAKALGFDVRALRKVIARRQKDSRAVAEEEMMLDLYLHALGEI